MASFIITYDLSKPGTDYEGLYTAIKEISGYWSSRLKSVWVVARTDLSASDIRDALTPHIDSNDKIFVARLSGEAAWRGIPEDGSKWLKDNLGH